MKTLATQKLINRLVDKKFILMGKANHAWSRYLDMPIDSVDGQYFLNDYNSLNKEIDTLLDIIDRAYKLGNNAKVNLPFDISIFCFTGDEDSLDIFSFEEEYMYVRPLVKKGLYTLPSTSFEEIENQLDMDTSKYNPNKAPCLFK